MVSSTLAAAVCPHCHTKSQRTNGSYRRRPADLPCVGYELQLDILVRRFFCDNDQCQIRTFGERFPSVMAPYSRGTIRLTSQQRQVAFALGGEPGSRLLTILGMPASADTLLRLIRRTLEPATATSNVLGIDDWAKRKGHTYGTILVDLEKHRVVDLLPDRTAAVVKNWLLAHPGVEVVARDRSKEYARGVTEGAPAALQVADRWHILVNLRQMLERLISHLYQELKQLPEIDGLQGPEPLTERRGHFPRTHSEQQASQASRARRMVLYEEIRGRRLAGQNIRQIADELGLHRATVRIHYYAKSFPERSQRKPKPSILDRFLPYLEKRHQKGCENALQLWRELKAMGYPGSRRQVSQWMQLQRSRPAPTTPKKYLKRRRGTSPTPKTPAQETGKKERLPSVKQLAWLLIRDRETLTEKDMMALRRICQEPTIERVYSLAQEFVEMIRQRTAAMLDPWLNACQQSGVNNLQTFAEGIKKDYDSIQAALETAWSNGQTEGQVNRLKMLKRQMYGRANFDLLRKRTLGIEASAPRPRPP